jgi:hypothetical protein
MTAPAPIAAPWRQWAKNNSLGVNFTWRAISAGRLKVRRVGKRMLVLDEDGLAFLRGLPEGPAAMPENFARKVAKARPATSSGGLLAALTHNLTKTAAATAETFGMPRSHFGDIRFWLREGRK